VFDKTERAFFAGSDVQAIVRPLQRALEEAEVSTQQTGPATWAGKSFRGSWSLTPRITVNALPTPKGFMLEVRVSADVESGGAIGMVICWFFCFPVAVILGLLAHQEFTRRQQELFQTMYGQIRHKMIEPNFPPPFARLP
jgi:hypothetical protein